MHNHPFLKGMIAIFLLGSIFMVIDCGGGTTERREATVVDREYMPAHYTHYRQHHTTRDGHGYYTTETRYFPADYTLMVRTWDGIKKIDTDATGYYAVHENQLIQYSVRVGCMTGAEYIATYKP